MIKPNSTFFFMNFKFELVLFCGKRKTLMMIIATLTISVHFGADLSIWTIYHAIHLWKGTVIGSQVISIVWAVDYPALLACVVLVPIYQPQQHYWLVYWPATIWAAQFENTAHLQYLQDCFVENAAPRNDIFAAVVL